MSAQPIAHALRVKAPWAEKRLWRILRDRRFSGYKFRRQHKMGEHYLDFYCAEARYDLELDGRQHGFPLQQIEDQKRDAYLRSRNIETRRFWNHQLRDVRFVRDTIWADLQARAPHPANAAAAKPTRLPTRAPRTGVDSTSHPSPQPSPR